MRVKSPFSQSALFGFISSLPSRDLVWRRMRLCVGLVAEPSIQGSGYNYGLKESRQSRLSAWGAATSRLSGIDPLDEPIENSRPDLVLADLVLDPVFKVRVVVNLDDDDRAVRFLDVDPIETLQLIARAALSATSMTGAGTSQMASVFDPPSRAPFGPCLMICQWPRAI